MWLSEEGIAIATNRTLRKLSADGNPVGTNPGNIVAFDNANTYEPYGNSGLIKLSDLTPTMDELVGGTMSMTWGAEFNEDKVTSEFFNAFAGGYAIGDQLLLVFLENNNDFGCTPGIYIVGVYAEAEEPISLTLKWGETTTPIDPKYLPGPLVIDLTSYGYITNGQQIPDGSLFNSVLDAIETGRTIYVKLNANFGDGLGNYSDIGAFIGATQKVDAYVLALTATTSFTLIESGLTVQAANTIAVTPQGMQVFLAVKQF